MDIAQYRVSNQVTHHVKGYLVRFFLGLSLSLAACLGAYQTNIEVGPHFNYTEIHFNRETTIRGHAAGVTAAFTGTHSYFKGQVLFEGTWNAAPLTGDPAERSSIEEYFLTLYLGPTFVWKQWQFDPYTGFGWDRFDNTQNPSLSSLSFRYDKLFIPVGFHLYWLSMPFRLGLQFEFRPDVYKDLRLIGLHLDPDWGYAFRSQLILSQIFPQRWGEVFISFIPFFDWNRFGEIYETNSLGVPLTLPRLVYWKLGVRFLVGVTF